MAVSAVPGSAHRAGPLDNGDIYSICIAYVPIAAKVVNKQMLSIKQWESRIIIFDRWMRMTALKRLPRSFMQIAFPTAWISASMGRLKVWKWIGKSNPHSAIHPPLEKDVNACLALTLPGQQRQEDGLCRCQEGQPRATLQDRHQASLICRSRIWTEHSQKLVRPFETDLLLSRDFPDWWRPQWVYEWSTEAVLKSVSLRFATSIYSWRTSLGIVHPRSAPTGLERLVKTKIYILLWI